MALILRGRQGQRFRYSQPDPYFDNVTLLGAVSSDSPQVYSDLSNDNRTGQAWVGDPELSSSQQLFGEDTLYFDGSTAAAWDGDLLINDTSQTSTGAQFDQSFTVELWFYPTVATFAGIWSLKYNQFGTTERGIYLYHNASGEIGIFTKSYSGSTIWNYESSSAPVNLNAWNHAVVSIKHGGSQAQYVGCNGSIVASGTSGNAQGASLYLCSQFVLGASNSFNLSNPFTGYIHPRVRVTKGVARYTGSYDVPTGPFPAE